MAEPMLKDIGKGTILLAEGAYDTNALRDFAEEKRARSRDTKPLYRRKKVA